MSEKIFFCYAHEDEILLNKLKSHLRSLQRQGLIEMWHDRDISAGTEWEQEINEQINTAQIILLLISPDFMNSDYCYSVEMKRALERHERKEVRVIPIILRPVLWETSLLGKLQALPTDARPVLKYDNVDDAFLNITQSIHNIIELDATHTASQSETPAPVPELGPTPTIPASNNSSPAPVSKPRGRLKLWSSLGASVILASIIVGLILSLYHPFAGGTTYNPPHLQPTSTSPHLQPTSTSLHIQPASCNSSANGIEGYSQRNYQGRCILITGNIADLTVLGFDHILSSIRFIGSYNGQFELALFRKAGYLDNCDTIFNDQPDLGSCVDQTVSVLVVSKLPPTP